MCQRRSTVFAKLLYTFVLPCFSSKTLPGQWLAVYPNVLMQMHFVYEYECYMQLYEKENLKVWKCTLYVKIYKNSTFCMFFGLYILLINKVYVFEWLIFRLNSIRFSFILVISFKLVIFMFLVILICWIILMYRIRYMDLNNEYLINRFYYLTLLLLILIIFSISRSNILTLWLI